MILTAVGHSKKQVPKHEFDEFKMNRTHKSGGQKSFCFIKRIRGFFTLKIKVPRIKTLKKFNVTFVTDPWIITNEFNTTTWLLYFITFVLASFRAYELGQEIHEALLINRIFCYKKHSNCFRDCCRALICLDREA